mmetsp:Transcript_64454/g.199868  ORF Transcript_64454/g.199868 Transcript_64454/m.199868 type:complete len:202 (+) Transcript_64454:285-890(+)
MLIRRDVEAQDPHLCLHLVEARLGHKLLDHPAHCRHHGLGVARLLPQAQSERVPLALPGLELRRRAQEAEGPAGHDGQARAEGLALLRGVACHDHGLALLHEARHEVPQRSPRMHVHASGGLVQEHDRRPGEEGDGHGELATVAAAKVLCPGGRVHFQVCLLEHPIHDGPLLAARDAAEPGVEQQRLTGRQPLRHCITLGA